MEIVLGTIFPTPVCHSYNIFTDCDGRKKILFSLNQLSVILTNFCLSMDVVQNQQKSDRKEKEYTFLGGL